MKMPLKRVALLLLLLAISVLAIADNFNTIEQMPLDLNGFPRLIDDRCTVDTGNGTGPIIDMGAYEFFSSDIDSDGEVTLSDFSRIAMYWLDAACGACGGADLTCDGEVNVDDLQELVNNWLVDFK